MRNENADNERKKHHRGRRRKKKGNIIANVILVIALIVFCVSGFQLFKIGKGYLDGRSEYDKVRKLAVTDDKNKNDKDKNHSEDGDDTFSVDFQKLLEINPDTIAWIRFPDEPSQINYPVVQGEDNDFYLYRFIDGTYNGSGSLFVDYRCTGDFSGELSVIYGHHMQNGTMLASICNYGKQEYYDAHPVLYLNTPVQNYRVEVFSGFITAADSSAYTWDFTSDAEYAAYLEKMKGFSDFDCDVEVGTGDHIIMLSTCTYEYDDSRFVVQAVRKQ